MLTLNKISLGYPLASFGLENGDALVPVRLDGSGPPLTFTTQFPYLGINERVLYVSFSDYCMELHDLHDSYAWQYYSFFGPLELATYVSVSPQTGAHYEIPH